VLPQLEGIFPCGATYPLPSQDGALAVVFHEAGDEYRYGNIGFNQLEVDAAFDFDRPAHKQLAFSIFSNDTR